MAEEKKVTATNINPLTGDAYEKPYSYDLNGDALYQQYKDRLQIAV